MAVDPVTGDLFILDAAGPRIVRIEPGSVGSFDAAAISTVDLLSTGLTDVRGLAFDTTSGHLHLVSPSEQRLYELTPAGALVAFRDLSSFQIHDPQGMVFAPSGDLTDDPQELSVYLADAGPAPDPNATRYAGQIIELSLVPTPAPGPISFISSLVRTTDTATFSPLTSSSTDTTSLDVRIAAGSDDAEERARGSVSLASSDLELVDDGGNQTVGMRFNGIAVPHAAQIVNAYLEFTVDETNTEATSLTIQGEAADTSANFVASSRDISSRPRTIASVGWAPGAWTTVNDAGPDQRTPDLAAVVQEIVNRPGWVSGNSLALIVTGAGHRTARAYDREPAGAPLVHVQWTAKPTDGPQPQALSEPGGPQPLTTAASSSAAGTTPGTER
jgi:hypothetical protein